MKKLLALLLALAMVFAFAACGEDPVEPTPDADVDQDVESDDPYAALEAVELIGGDNAGVGAAGQLCGELIADKVAEITNGKLTISYFPNGALGSDTDMQQAILDGDQDLVICQTAQTVQFVPEVAIFDLPCVFAAYDAETIDSVLNEGAFYEALEACYEDKGLMCLGFLQGATFRLTTSNKALNTLEDFEGLVIRTMENTYHMAFWGDWGSNPTPLTWSEVYIALQQGMMEAQENAADTITGASLYEVQDYLCLTNHILYCNEVIVSADTYANLDPLYQAALDQAVDEALAEIGAQLTQINDDNVAICVENGMEVIEYEAEFYDELKEAAAPTYEMIAGDVGQELVDLLQEELAK